MFATLLLAAVVQNRGDPSEHESPSCKYVLHVDSSSRSRRGPANYSLWKDGDHEWTQELPFTLHEAAITDSGIAVGYGYTGGKMGESQFVVVVLGPDGEVVLDERTDCTASEFPHEPDNPNPLGLTCDGKRDGFAVRIADEDINRRIETWQRYKISTAERLADLRPAEHMDFDDPRFHSIVDALPLPGTDLHLLSWWSQTWMDTPGAIFTLIRDSGEVVWRLDRPNEYAVEGNLEARNALRSKVYEDGTVLGVGHAAFVLWFAKDNQRASFRAVRDDNEEHGWRVDETRRSKYTSRASGEFRALPQLELVPLDAVQLTRSPVDRPAIGRPWAWTFDGEGGFFVVRQVTETQCSRIHLSSRGEVIHEQPLQELPKAAVEGTVRWHHLGGDRWLFDGTAYAEDKRRRTVLCANGSTGKVAPLPGFALPARGTTELDIEEIAPLGDGFVVLGCFDYPSTRTSNLLGFDGHGAMRWSLRQNDQDETPLFSPWDVTVTSGEMVVVIDSSRKELQVFDKSGKHVRNIELGEVCGQDLNYPVGVSSDPDGGVLVYDHQGAPPLWHVDLDQPACRPITPRFPDGRSSELLARNARFAPDGTLWTSDGYSLIALDDEGVVAKTVGSQPLEGVLYEPGASAILPDGRICVQDERTGALHVWAESGELLFIGETEARDSDDVNSIARMAAAPNGSVWVEAPGSLDATQDKEYLGWSAEGKRLGRRQFGEHVAFPRDGEHRWTWGSNTDLTLRDGSGTTLLSVPRRPDGRWLASIIDVCFGPDGNATVLDTDSTWGPHNKVHVSLYTPEGAPLETLTVPVVRQTLKPSPKPTPAKYITHIHRSESWILLSSWSPDVILVRPSGESGEFAVAEKAPGISWAHGLSADGKLLLSLNEEELVLHRYALP